MTTAGLSSCLPDVTGTTASADGTGVTLPGGGEARAPRVPLQLAHFLNVPEWMRKEGAHPNEGFSEGFSKTRELGSVVAARGGI